MKLHDGEKIDQDSSYNDRLLDHFNKTFGGKSQLLDKNLQLGLLIDIAEIYFIPPDESRNYYVVFTCGMGKKSMFVDDPEKKYAELCIFMPVNSRLENISRDPTNPYFLLIKNIAIITHYPFTEKTFLGQNHSYSHGPLLNTNLEAAIISTIHSYPDLSPFRINKKKVNIYGIIEVYREELDLKLERGIEFVMQRFSEENIDPFLCDIQRINLLEGRKITNPHTAEPVEVLLERYNANPNTLEEWHKFADLLYSKNLLASYQRVLHLIQEKFPQDFLVHYKLGQIYNRTNKARIAKGTIVQSDAKPFLKTCVELNPTFVPAWEGLGVLYSEEGEINEALKCITKCTELEPSIPKYWRLLSNAYDASGDKEKARDCLNTGLKLHEEKMEHLDLVEKHLEWCFGKEYGRIYHTSFNLVTTDLLFWAPTPKRNYWVVCTLGMSTKAMNDENPELQYCELMMFLKADEWNLNMIEYIGVGGNPSKKTSEPPIKSYPPATTTDGEIIYLEQFLQIDDFCWPILNMLELTILPFEINKSLGDQQIINKPESKIMRSYGGWLVKTPEPISSRFRTMKYKEKIINFYIMVPLMPSEIDFYSKCGLKRLLDLFNEHEIGWIISQSRKSVV